MNTRDRREPQITKSAAVFEGKVKILAASMGIEVSEARRLQRTINVMDHLSGEVAKDIRTPPGMSAMDYAETFRAAIHSTQLLRQAMSSSEMSQVFLAWAHNSINDAKKSVMRRDTESAMEIMTHVSGLMFGAAKRLSADARSHAATKAAHASHSAHNANRELARKWYAQHKALTKDAAAERMAKDHVIPASFRTIRGYLTGQ